ncbi:Hypothetical protein SRAE_2000467300 [Strongyloides ratti]|uniref:F-box domain-containing protein n=1 Tax=Strongyloides ratti TaxID=34506 RepID=A0A090LR00_STRRB|nr:Hypothetical protein SRAE_2000467300 [Strongyloides ratti]CEF70031.1 Hypothetical protein SRAE_2000467300 [Strongyloides ratti]
MTLEVICFQYPIAQALVNNLISIKDFTSLIQTSNQMKNYFINCSFRKTFNTYNNTLTLEHDSLISHKKMSWNNILVNYNGSKCTLDILYTILYMFEEEEIEHINTINIRFSDNYNSYNEDTRISFGKYFAQFINKLFEKFFNATIFQILNISKIQFYVIKHIKSSKIQVIRKLNLYELAEFSQKYKESSCDIFKQLKSLKKVDFFLRNIFFYDINCYKNMLENIFELLSRKNDNFINFYGNVFQNDFKNFSKILKMAEKYNLNISFNESFVVSKELFKTVCIKSSTFSVNNVKLISIVLWDKKILQLFFQSLQFFTNLTKLKIQFSDQLVNSTIEYNSTNIFSNNINQTVYEKMLQIEELFIGIKNLPFAYANNDHYEKSLEIKNQMTKEICTLLGVKLKTLVLNNIPNLEDDISYILSTKCYNLENIYLSVLHTITPNFIEKMEKLKFVNLKGLYKLNIPSNVQMFLNYLKDVNINEGNNFKSTKISYNFFKKFYNRNFKHFFEHICDENINYIVLFDNILDWKNYFKCLDNFLNFF